MTSDYSEGKLPMLAASVPWRDILVLLVAKIQETSCGGLDSKELIASSKACSIHDCRT